MTLDVVAALIWQGDRFLICQRPAHKACALLWEFPGGKVEAGETEQQALIRECEEELALTLSVGSLYERLTHSYPDFDVRLSLYSCRIEKGSLQLKEHADSAFILPGDIPRYHFCPADTQILERLMEESA